VKVLSFRHYYRKDAKEDKNNFSEIDALAMVASKKDNGPFDCNPKPRMFTAEKFCNLPARRNHLASLIALG